MLDLSVYNSVARVMKRDMTINAVANLLRTKWIPGWAQDVEEVVTVESVTESAERLKTQGLIVIHDGMICVQHRDPKRRGRMVIPNKARDALLGAQ